MSNLNLSTISLIMCSLFSINVWSVELLSNEKAIKRMFLTAEKVKEETKTLTSAQKKEIQRILGGKLHATTKVSGVNENEYTFHFGFKAGAKTGVAVIEEQEDEWGQLKFIVVLDPKTGKVINIAMMKYIDGRARALSNRSFLKSFFGKGPDAPLKVFEDINAITGATVSTDILCFIVKKVMILYQNLYLK